MHVIITGSRTIPDTDTYIDEVLTNGRLFIQSITHGVCPTGADFLAGTWAEAYNVPVHKFPAYWAKHGHAAGPMRNADMIDQTVSRYHVHNIVVLAFTDKILAASRGTNHCVGVAKSYGLTVHHFRTDLRIQEF